MLPLTRKELKSHEDAKECYICGKNFIKKFFKDLNYRKVRDHCCYTGKYRGTAHSICNLKLNVLNEIPVVFHSSSTYGYHFIMKELASLKVHLNVLGKTVKFVSFPVPIRK